MWTDGLEPPKMAFVVGTPFSPNQPSSRRHVERRGRGAHCVAARPAGELCSSYCSEMAALQSAMAHLLVLPVLNDNLVAAFAGSGYQPALVSDRNGPVALTTMLDIRKSSPSGDEVREGWSPGLPAIETVSLGNTS